MIVRTFAHGASCLLFGLLAIATFPSQSAHAQDQAVEKKGATATSTPTASTTAKKKKLVILAGKPSHPPRMHEFNAGVLLLNDCLKGNPDVETHYVLNGWPSDLSVFDEADAVVFYMDGGPSHEAVQEGGERLKLIDQWTRRGVGIGCMHYGVEVVADQAGDEFKRWIGGHYENMFSCNPIWEPSFAQLPEHPITRGVEPFGVQDEWYFNMRFVADLPGNQPAEVDGMRFTPILVATPSDDVRDGPYVYPAGPYAHIEANAARAEAMMWAVERADGGRGFGFTGGHFHDNWANPNFRKVILNSLLWVAGAEVPEGGVRSELKPGQIDQNLDPKPAR